MKKLLSTLTIVSLVLWSTGVFAAISGDGPQSAGGVVRTASECNAAAYYPAGTLCQDTDDNKLYLGTGAAVVEITNQIPTSVTVADTTDTTSYVGLFESATGNLGPKTDAGITYNAGTGVLAATGLAGAFNGTTGASTPAAGTFTTMTYTKLLTAAATELTLTDPGAITVTQFAHTVDSYGDAATDTLATISGGTDGQIVLLRQNTAGRVITIAETDNIIIPFGTTLTMYKGSTFHWVQLYYDGNQSKWVVMGMFGDDLSVGTLTPEVLNLPSSNADPATTAGQIRHDSTDTDASAGGIIEWWDGTNTRRVVDGAAVAAANYTVITKTEYLPIAYFEDGAAAPNAASVWADTRKAKVRIFNADADDDVEGHWMVPDDYVGGIKFRVIGFVTHATAPANTETVIFNLAGCSVGNSDDGGCTLGTGVDSTFTADATYAQHDRWATAWSNEITVTNIAAGESAMLKLFRDVDDTYAQTIGAAGIEIKYKARVLLVDRY